MFKSCRITESQSYLIYYSGVVFIFIMLFIFLIFEVTLFLRNLLFFAKEQLITTLFHICHFILIFVGVFYVTYDKIVWMPVLNTYLK